MRKQLHSWGAEDCRAPGGCPWSASRAKKCDRGTTEPGRGDPRALESAPSDGEDRASRDGARTLKPAPSDYEDRASRGGGRARPARRAAPARGAETAAAARAAR